jgi:uncharacterized protein YxjI
MLDLNTFVVKEQAKMFSSKPSYDILDEKGQPLATVTQKVSGLWTALGLFLGKDRIPISLEVRSKKDDSLLFSVRRSGMIMKKVQLHDGEGKMLGRYKAKMMSIKGGYHVYDAEGKHVADVKGKLLKSEYTFFTPDGKTEMGKVSKQWGGMGRELFTSADTYGVQINPDFTTDKRAKMLILGAALAIDAIFKAGGGAAAAAGKEEEKEGDGE